MGWLGGVQGRVGLPKVGDDDSHRFAIIFALQIFLHCKYLCIAIIFALQSFLHCNYFCVAIIFALLRLLRFRGSWMGVVGGG